jgi:hypothetical protein
MHGLRELCCNAKTGGRRTNSGCSELSRHDEMMILCARIGFRP